MTLSVLCVLIAFGSMIITTSGVQHADFQNDLDIELAKFKARFTEDWKQQTLRYDGPDIKVKLTISDKVFYTSTNVLFNQRHGVTLFIHAFLGHDKNSINHNCNVKMEQKDVYSSKSPTEGNLFKLNEAVAGKMENMNKNTDSIIELYFDRNPGLFHYILDYLRGYSPEYDLYELNVRMLTKLLADAQYFGIAELQEMVTSALHSRFNEYLCTTPSAMAVLDSGRRLKRIRGFDSGNHQTCSVYGILYTGNRYVEFEIIFHGNRRQMIGVTEASTFRPGPYPGYAGVPGISLYGENGNIYRNGGGEQGWSPSFYYGDRVGVLVEISDDKRIALLTYYLNGKKVKSPLDLKQYMNINNGVVFTVNMHDNNEEVRIIQNAIIPT